MKNQETSVKYLDIYSTSFWSLDKETKEAALVNELSKIKYVYHTEIRSALENFEIWTSFANAEFRLKALTTISNSKVCDLEDVVLDILVKSLIHEIFSSCAVDYTQRMDLLNLLARSPDKDLSWFFHNGGQYRYYGSLSVKNAFKLIYDSTQRVNNSYSPIEIAAQNCNIAFLINILKMKYNFHYKDPTKDLECKLNDAFQIILTSTEIDYAGKGGLTKMLDYLQRFYIPGLETRLLASLKRQIWERSLIEPSIKVNIDLEYYNIDGNDIDPPSCCDFFMCFLSRFSSSKSNSAATVAIQEAIPEDIAVASLVHEVELAEGQSLISSPSNGRTSKRAELQF